MSDPKPLELTITLNVLKDLGINLYSNMAAVLAEAVANAWDADAKNVSITTSERKIVIQDDGHGMTREDIQNKYLTVGYQRREGNNDKTPTGRAVMGRKGIGKLSLFSIAGCIEVHSSKDREKTSFLMNRDNIQKDAKKNKPYQPEIIASPKDFSKGTRIILTNTHKSVNQRTLNPLRQRLARRFSVIGGNTFNVSINDEKVSPEDRGYYSKIQYIWHYGKKGKNYASLCNNVKDDRKEKRSENSDHYQIEGWIGTTHESGDVKTGDGDDLNKIVVMVRGKLAHEDILPKVPQGRMFSKYIMGELHADFLDNEYEDIATSSRQGFREDDERFQELIVFLREELNHIGNQWTNWRNEDGVEKAIELIPALRQWIDDLSHDAKRHARSLFGKIYTMHVKEQDRKELIKNGVLAFAKLRIKDNLDELDSVIDNPQVLKVLFANINSVEEVIYADIVRQRLKAIKVLEDLLKRKSIEKEIQKHLFDSLWLLDPAWGKSNR